MMAFAARLCSAGCLLLMLAGRPCEAQETEPVTATMFGDLIELGSQIEIRTADGEQLQFVRQPLMNWSNPTRNTQQGGSIFVWQHKGRPLVIGSVFTFVYADQARLKHELHTLAQQPLVATYRSEETWKPLESGIRWHADTSTAAPRVDPRQRVTQMRGIARQFSATLETADGKRTQLELKPTPLYRYASPQEKVQDGAIFSFADGTDPEVLMLIEAVEDEQGNAGWRYAFARFHYLRVTVRDRMNGVVWEAEPALELQTVNRGDPRTISWPFISYYVERRALAP